MLKRSISILLALIMVLGVFAVVPFTVSAADNTAKVSLYDIEGNLVKTNTYGVGETFEVIVYLNTSQIATIGSLKANQYYTSSVLKLADKYDENTGSISDTAAMFPVTKSATVANGKLDGKILFSASTPDLDPDGFDFCSDDAKLIVTHYTVKAAGNAEIKNIFTTLAIADWFSTKIINKGEIRYDIFDHITMKYTLRYPEYVSTEINSDNDNKHFFYFNENEEIEDLLASMPSVQYNPRLAHFLACMARSAYTPDLAKKNYDELGFTVPEEQHCDSGDPIAGFYVGEKKLDNGKKIVMVTIRGSDDWSEWLQTNFNLGNSAMMMSTGLHSGFLASAQKVYNYLAERYVGTPPGDLTFVITGHSLGGAVGNLLAKWLDSSDVPTACLYAYNFACPNVGIGPNDVSVWNENGKHNNIINIGNWCDKVSHEPGLGVEILSVANRLLCGLNGWHKWKRFGVSYWFDNGLYNDIDAHDMGVYLDYLEKEYDETHFTQKEFEVKAISAHCPVDVVVYDSKGNPIAGTINNEPNYYGYEPGEKALIFIDGDRKLFHVFNNEAYEVKLVGTDEGEMEYGVSTGDMTSGDVYTEKWFEAVPLTDGKEMVGKNVNVLDEDTNTISQDEKLLLADQSTEILENGEETDYTVKYILGDADDSGEVEAVDATWLQRYIASFATPYDFDTLMHGDVDYDDEADITDVTMIQRYLAQFSTPYLIGADVV